LALYQLAHESRSESDETPVPVCIGVPGVWNWLGKIGIVTGPNGQSEQQKGPVPGFSLLIWEGRRAYIIYDTNVFTDSSVAEARSQLARELASRGAEVYFVDLKPEDGINGIDDFLAKHGPGSALNLFAEARRFVPKHELASLLWTDL